MAKTATKKVAVPPPPAGEAEHPQGAAVEAAPEPPPHKVIHIPAHLRHDQIVPDPDNARTSFDEAELKGLAETLFSHGMKQPIRCLPANPEGKWQMFMGERRWRAWGALVADGRWPKDHTELVLVEAADELTRLEAGLIENLQRINLNHMEAGLGFEKLATRCKRSNKEIAEAIGRTPEFVQQHRRLAQLEETDQQRLREGRLSMHDALRILQQPKALTFEDLQRGEKLALAEIIDSCRCNADKRYYYADRVEVSYLAGGDKVLKQLVGRRLVSFIEKDWSTKKAYVQLQYEARGMADGVLKALGPADRRAAIAILRKLRLEAIYNPLRDKGPAPDVQDTPYTSAWLNGPFELSPAAAKELKAEKESKAKERDRAKAEKAKRAAYCVEANTLADELRASGAPAVDPRLQDLFRRSKIKLPVSVKNNRIVDADDATVGDANWRFGDHQEAVCLALALAINAATGWAAAPAADVELSPALKALAGVKATTAAPVEA